MSFAESEDVVIDYLVVGAGPAGASLAAFLGQNGLKGMVISRSPSTATSPRAHLLNPFALETLRDLDLEKDTVDHATRGELFQSFRWAKSLVGEEYGQIQAWGSHPSRLGDIAKATPCTYLDMPQSHLEPILVRYGSHNGFKFRFSTHLVSVEAVPGSGDSICTIRDLISNHEFKVRAKYVFGADGIRSKVAENLGIKFKVQPQGGVACNIIFKADLAHLIPRARYAGIHLIIEPKKFLGMVPILRMIRPWNQWMLVCSFGPNSNRFENHTTDSQELVDLIRQSIGDDTIDVEIKSIDHWVVHEAIAEKYHVDGRNAFILGDAAHRNPPAHGNGSNTAIQDSYNLGWKVAYVAKGLAGPKLLETYNVERQPVGATLVREANKEFDKHIAVWHSLGQFAPTVEEGDRQIAVLSEPTLEGDKARAQLHAAFEGKRPELENLGLSMNQWYDSSAVYLADETEPRPALVGNPITEVLISTYPGTRLPHAWIDIPTRRKLISTHDLAGHGAFCLFIGHRGAAWRTAASKISKATGIPIKTYGIGINLDYIDIYRDWYKIREVGDDGCVLVRPDRFVAWRSKTAPADCEGKLQHVLDSILSRDGLPKSSLTSN
ncbi:FAD binding domain-containing protein [Xylaria intraflava]|nr:FAD binding domain-containing protein [Xylaria intraflava]